MSADATPELASTCTWLRGSGAAEADEGPAAERVSWDFWWCLTCGDRVLSAVR